MDQSPLFQASQSSDHPLTLGNDFLSFSKFLDPCDIFVHETFNLPPFKSQLVWTPRYMKLLQLIIQVTPFIFSILEDPSNQSRYLLLSPCYVLPREYIFTHLFYFMFSSLLNLFNIPQKLTEDTVNPTHRIF
jgi:hypothetical protein